MRTSKGLRTRPGGARLVLVAWYREPRGICMLEWWFFVRATVQQTLCVPLRCGLVCKNRSGTARTSPVPFGTVRSSLPGARQKALVQGQRGTRGAPHRPDPDAACEFHRARPAAPRDGSPVVPPGGCAAGSDLSVPTRYWRGSSHRSTSFLGDSIFREASDLRLVE